MKGKNLVLLVLAAVLVGAAAYLTSRQKQQEQPAQLGRNVLPDLAVNEVRKIVLYSKEKTIAVAKTGEKWTVPAAFDYPADFEKVAAALRKLADLKVQQVVHLDPRQFADLELLSPLETGATASNRPGLLLKLLDQNDKPLASLILGKLHERAAPEGPMSFGGYPDGRFLAAEGGEVFLVGDTLEEISAEPPRWLKTDLINVSAQDIVEVAVTSTNRETIRLTRDEKSGAFTLAGLAETEELNDSKVNSLSSALAYLTFSDVADPALAPDQTGLDAPAAYDAKLKDGRAFTIRLGKAAEDKRYARLEAVFNPPPEKEAPNAATNAPAAGDDASKAKKQEREKLEKQTRELNEKLQKWTYLLPSYKADAMMASRADIVKKKEIKPDASTNAVEAAYSPVVSNAPAAARASDAPLPKQD